MKRCWNADELVEHWSLSSQDIALLHNKTEHNRLGFALMLKFFQIEGRFPSYRLELPNIAIDHVAKEAGVAPELILLYDWKGRSIEYHRAQIRAHLGFRTATVQDAQELTEWLCTQSEVYDASVDHLKAIVFQRCRALHIEPPTVDRIDRLVRSAMRTVQDKLCETIYKKLPPHVLKEMDSLLDTAEEETAREAPKLSLSVLKTDPGPVGLESILAEISKLQAIRQMGLPSDLFRGVSPKLILRLRQRAAAEPPRELRAHPAPIRCTLLSALCCLRAQEITDNLVELLIQVIHKISVRAEQKVEQEMLDNFRKVTGKNLLLFQIAEVSLEHPDERVRDVVFPVAGEKTLQDLVREYKASGLPYRNQVHTVMRASYQSYYRRMVPKLLEILEFRSNNAAHQPVVRAIELLKKHAQDTQRFYTDPPIEGVIRTSWRDLLVEEDKDGKPRVNRINYEICVLIALREKLRCKEIWVLGADRFRNPDDDLPADFAQQRDSYYAALNQPREAEAFIAQLRQRMTQALEKLDTEIPKNAAVKILEKGKGWIRLSPLEAQPTAVNVDRLKGEVAHRWPMTSLLDILKETDLRLGFTDPFTSVASREMMERDTIQKRLLLCLYGLGTNTGLKRVSAGNHGVSYRDLLYIRRRFLHKEALRNAIAQVVNGILDGRQANIWGEGTSACASDSKKFGAWDQNLMTEWHVRYGGRGVMIYWHVEKKSACIYSQLKTCSSSEVAAMIEGILRHCTDMEVTKSYVDTHGQSTVAFAFCHLLGFELLPRLKGIHSQKLYRPEAGQPAAYSNLQPVLTRPIDWDLIRTQYDEMVKFATALRLGTADAESILRRFTKNNLQHPTYQALMEMGRAVKTIFLCQYLGSEALRREVHEGLNVIENWNSANGFIFYGRGGEIATNRRDDQELAMLALHLLQSCLIYINTLMVQRVLAETFWTGRLTATDLRALTPLFYLHVNPYGKFELDMGVRLSLDAAA